MGQRHHVYICARVNGTYRVLAVVHHASMYGISVVRRSIELVNIFRAKANESDIRRELSRAEEMDWSKGSGGTTWDAKATIFPFITTCAVIGTARCDQRRSVLGFATHGVCPEDINLSYEHDDNSQSFTVLDITEPANTSHAFFYPESEIRGQQGAEDPTDSIAGNTLLSAETYLSAYSDAYWTARGESPSKLVGDILKCDALPKLRLSAIQSLWPQSSWSSQCEAYINDTAGAGTSLPSSLRAQCLSRVIDEALRNDPSKTIWTRHAEQLSDFLPQMRARLREAPTIVPLSKRVDLLVYAFADCDMVDLTPFVDLRAAELLELVNKLSERNLKTLKALVLPDMKDLTEEILRKILRNGKIIELNLGETYATEVQDLLEILKSTSLQFFSCPDLYKRAFQSHKAHPKEDDSIRKGTGLRLSRAFFPWGAGTVSPLIQLVYIRKHHNFTTSRLQEGGVKWSELIPTAHERRTLGRRSNFGLIDTPTIFVLPLTDALLSASAMGSTLLPILRYLVGRGDFELRYTTGQALAMSMGYSKQQDKRISPVPAASYYAWDVNRHAPGIENPAYGWSLYVFHEFEDASFDEDVSGEPAAPRIRFAFVSTREDESVVAFDEHQFFGSLSHQPFAYQAEALADEWQRGLSALENVCDPCHGGPSDIYNQSVKARSPLKGTVSCASSEEVEEAFILSVAYNEEATEGPW